LPVNAFLRKVILNLLIHNGAKNLINSFECREITSISKTSNEAYHHSRDFDVKMGINFNFFQAIITLETKSNAQPTQQLNSLKSSAALKFAQRIYFITNKKETASKQRAAIRITSCK
jgi:hypothetical protein